MSEPTLADILAGQTFEEVGGGGASIKFARPAKGEEVGDTLIGTYRGFTEKKSSYVEGKLDRGHKFTLAVAGTFDQGPKDEEVRVDFEAGSEVTLWGIGNLDHLLKSVSEDQLVKVERLVDEIMPDKPKGKNVTSSWKVYKAK